MDASRPSQQSHVVCKKSLHDCSVVQKESVLVEKKMSNVSEERAIRLRDVMKLVGMSRSWIYLRMARDEFPKPAYRLGKNAVAWSLSQVMDWLEEQRVVSAR